MSSTVFDRLCEECLYLDRRKLTTPVAERDRVCPKCHKRMVIDPAVHPAPDEGESDE